MSPFVAVVVAVVFQSRSDVQRRERCKHEGLQGCNQQFKRRDEQGQQNRRGRNPDSL